MENYKEKKARVIKVTEKGNIISSGRESVETLEKIIGKMPDGPVKEQAEEEIKKLKVEIEAGSKFLCGGPAPKSMLADPHDPEKAE